MFEVVDRLISGLKKVRDVAQRMRDAELLDALANLTLDSAQLKSDMAAVREENLKLRDEIQELRRAADIRSKIELRDGLYYAREAIAGYGSGPFCPACLDGEGRLMTLVPVRDGDGRVFRMDCVPCKRPYLLKSPKDG